MDHDAFSFAPDVTEGEAASHSERPCRFGFSQSDSLLPKGNLPSDCAMVPEEIVRQCEVGDRPFRPFGAGTLVKIRERTVGLRIRFPSRRWLGVQVPDHARAG